MDNSKVIQAAYDNKLLLVPAADNVVRVLPPLTISGEEIRIARDRFESLIKDVIKKQ